MQNKIRVLLIITRLNIGGASSHIILLSERLNSGRYESMLICGMEDKHEGNMYALAQQKNVVPVVIPQIRRNVSAYHDITAIIKLYSIIRKYRPHIIHVHTSKAGTLGRIAGWLAGVPVIVFTLHGSYFHDYFSPIKTSMFVLVDRILALISDRIIAVSQQERREILEQNIGDKDKVINIPLGLELNDLFDCEKHTGILRTQLGIGTDKKLIGYIARLSSIKGHKFLLDAAKIVLHYHDNVIFLMVGDGELRGELEEYAESIGIDNKVIFLGFRRDLPVVYADLDIVVLSSLSEGLPVTVIEGMSAGKPVVATRVGGVPELLDEGKAGIIVPPSNPEELAKGITWMLNNPAMAEKMGEYGRQTAMSRYRIETLVENIAKLYEQLLEEKGIRVKV